MKQKNYSRQLDSSTMIRSQVLLPLGALFLILAPNLCLAQLPNGLCAAKDVACELQDDNVVEIVGGVSDVEECRQTCIGNSSGMMFERKINDLRSASDHFLAAQQN